MLPNWAVRAMSGLPPLATERRTSLVVRFVPNSDIALSTPLLHWSNLISQQPTRRAETPGLTRSVYVERIGSTQ
jgi:hypothetical protein